MWGKHIQKVLSQHKPPTTNHHTDHQHLFNIQIIYNSHFVPHSSMFYILRAWSQGFFFQKFIYCFKDFKLYSKYSINNDQKSYLGSGIIMLE